MGRAIHPALVDSTANNVPVIGMDTADEKDLDVVFYACEFGIVDSRTFLEHLT